MSDLVDTHAADTQIVRDLNNMWSQSRAHTDILHNRWTSLYRALFETGNSVSPRSQMPMAKRPRDNEIFPITDSLAGWLQDQNPPIYTTPASYDSSSPFFQQAESLAADLNQLILTSLRDNRYKTQRQITIWDELTYGTGIQKVTWDEDANRGSGGALVQRIDPYCIHPDPLATSMRDLTWLVEDRNVYKAEAVERYGSAAERAVRASVERPSQTQQSGTHAPMALAGGLVPPGSMIAQPTIWPDAGDDAPRDTGANEVVTVRECWFLDAGQWWFAAWSGTILLQHPIPVEDIYEHGRPPYVRFVATETGEFWGPSLVEYLLDLQMGLEDNLFHINHNIRLCGNPVLLEPRQGGTGRTSMKMRPGQRIPVQGSSNMYPQWLTPPSLPPYVVQLLQFWLSAMERASGLQQVNRGQSPGQRQSQGTTDKIAESGLVRVRSMLSNMEDSTRDLGELLASVITDNYTDPAILAVVGPGATRSVLALRSKHFYASSVEGPARQINDVPLRFAISVEPGSAMPASKQAKEDLAFRLRTMLAIDDQALLDVLEFPDRKTILQRVQQQKLMGLLQPPGRQRPQSSGSQPKS